MQNMNYETVGSERAQISGVQSNIPYIINEDWAMVGKVVSPANPDGDGVIPHHWDGEGYPCVIKCVKIWDESSEPINFFVLLRYHGKTGYPGPDKVQNSQYLVLHRVGEYWGQNGAGFELHTPDDGKISWVAFINEQPLLAIQISGSSGIPVVYKNGAWVANGASKPVITTGTKFYSSQPLVSSAIYLGIDLGPQYLVEARGYGELAKTISTPAINHLVLHVDVDVSGKLLAVRMQVLS